MPNTCQAYRRIMLTTLLLLLAAIAVVAQTKAPEPTKPTTPAPQLTEIQKLKMENLTLKFNQLQAQIRDAQQEQQKLGEEYKALVAEVSKEHPGYSVDAQGNLVKVPTKATAEIVKPEAKPEVKK